MKLGQTVKVTMVDRALTDSGKPCQFDPPLTVEGPVVARSDFIFPRVCVQFIHQYQPHTVWKDVISGEVQPVDP